DNIHLQRNHSNRISLHYVFQDSSENECCLTHTRPCAYDYQIPRLPSTCVTVNRFISCVNSIKVIFTTICQHLNSFTKFSKSLRKSYGSSSGQYKLVNFVELSRPFCHEVKNINRLIISHPYNSATKIDYHSSKHLLLKYPGMRMNVC